MLLISRRIGLRTTQSIGGRGLVCPRGEQVTNGSFELGTVGDTPTGWTQVDPFNWATKDCSSSHTGSCQCYYAIGSGIYQDIITSTPQACLTALGFWEKHFDWLAYVTRTRVTLTYTDNTTTVIPLNFVSTGKAGVWTAYAYVNLLSYVEASKTVKRVQIECLATSGFDWYTDDVTCRGA